jgi:cell division septation protein DedD
MVSILDLQHRPETAEPSASIPQTAVEPAAPAAHKEEFEFVVGGRQMASLLFVFTIILVVCVAAAYLAGKSIASKTAPAFPAASGFPEPEPTPIVMNQEPLPVAEPPLFGEPKNGSVYIQMGAVEKPIAVIFAEGLRKRGLIAFVAPGPNDKIMRVLIGPLPDPASYVRAKDIVDRIGLSTFARRFPN